MRITIISLISFFALFSGPSLSETTSEADQSSAALLRTIFEGPLQAELEARGLAPTDAATASKRAVDKLVGCWAKRKDEPARGTEKMLVVRLGGEAIVTDATPCMYEFLALAGVKAQ